jgi:amino acid adenylation domain-containing protein/FkbH-like protein
MKKDFDSFFPKHLELWIDDDVLKYRVEEKELDSSKTDFLKSNKDFFKEILRNTKSKKIKVLPLAHNQKAIWFIGAVNPSNVSYNISLAAEVQGTLNIDALRITLSSLIEQHQSLRTIFAVLPGIDNTVCQIVLDKISPAIEQIDGLKLSDEQIKILLNKKYRLPFDLENGPLLRLTIVNKSDSAILSFNFHHITCDAISLRNLLNEFINIYDSLIQNTNILKISPASDYNNFIFDQIEFLNSEKGESQIDYWVNQLHGRSHTLNLPAKFKRPSVHQFNGSTLLFKIEGEMFHNLWSIAKNNNVTFNVLLFSAFEFFISKISGQGDFCVGLPAAARTNKIFEDIFGYLINMLPLACSIRSQESFIDFLNENKIRLYESLENQDIPFPIIVEKISPKRDLSRTPIFQVIFNYLNKKSLGCLLHFLGDSETTEYSSWGSVFIKPYKIFDQEGQVDLTLEIVDDESKLLCALKFNSDLFDNDSINLFKDEFLRILDLIINDLSFKPSWLSDENPLKPEKPLLNINITGTFTVEPVEPYLEFWLKKFGVTPLITFPGYNQVFSQLLNPGSEFNSNISGYNILLIRFEDWIKDKNSEGSISDFSKKVDEIEDAFSVAIQLNTQGKYILAFCPPSPGILKNPILSEIIAEAENRLTSILKSKSNILVLNSGELLDTYDIHDYYEELGEEIGHIPFSDNFFISLSTIIARKIHLSFSLPFKAIAVDCDNTLWKGVVAEEGPTGVKVGPGEKALQEFLIEQNKSGILICLCSKNREEDVFEVFDKNDQMVLKREHLSFYKINWNPKSENLIQLAKDINIGLDSFVFIDDNPMECAEVRNNTPEVLTIQLPEDGINIKQLNNSWIFDKLRITDEDRKRSEKYREEAVRINFRSSFKTYKDFITGLNLKVEIKPFQDGNISRISQLTYRTNQFNFTTLRKSESEIKNLSFDKNVDCFQVTLSDRFGDYGLTGVIIVNKSSGYSVETFLLSCRVLGKGVEHFLISFLGEKARLNNSVYLTVSFRKTDKNTPAENFINSNFGDFGHYSNEIQIFNIPVERAIGFTFDPDSNISNQEFSEDEKTKDSVGLTKNQNRNDFYYLILEKFLTLDKIIAELNKNLVIRSASDLVPDQRYKQTEKNVMSVWQQILKSDNFNNTDNFFDIGGHSVLIPQIVIKLFRQFNIQINIVDIFQFPTVRELAAFIDGESKTEKPVPDISTNSDDNRRAVKDIAIIGMTGRFSGVKSTEDYWKIISSGKEAITYYTKEELLKKGVDKALLENDNYVLANGNLENADQFDSSFFGVTPREADFMDPQHRVFLESCYEALENAGYTSEKYPGEIGVFAGCGMNNYLAKNLFQHPESLRSIGEFQTIINNNSDYLTTRVSYKLNLTGPSIDIQTACSTSLVAIHIACQNLISRSCDMALAGGVFIQIPHAEGYMYEAGGIFSPDGHCKPFDSEANGTLFGEGSGVVVLKRLEDAVSDCDTILGVIKGTAINNDGSNKVGYMAPSINGQAAVVRKAIAVANIAPDTISYIETHGTGTKLGDPIEVNALNSVFRNASARRNYCALGSVKANIGHLDAAAGVAGVIKVVLMLNNKKLVPLLNFKKPNPELPLNDTPFYLNTSLSEWTTTRGPRRAGISSFGIGGTNAHCILEEAPVRVKEASGKKYHLLPVTAKTPDALKNLKQSIYHHVLDTDQDIADISFTLQQGRSHYKHRSLLICKTESDKSIPLLMKDTEITGIRELFNPRVVFMFTGQGSQYIGMTRDLYNEFSLFRDIIDKADVFLKANFSIEILKYILQDNDDSLQNEINQTSVAQPLLFTVQYAIARLLEEFGLKPDVLIGHSIGEYAAACISEIFDFEDALTLVAHRGKLMQEQKPGAMLSVQLSCNELSPFVSEKVNLSLKNAPDLNVLSGEFQDIEEAEKKIIAQYPDIHLSRLKTSHAFHSYMMEPVLGPFSEILKKIKFGESRIPFISNLTGTWAVNGELSNAQYWTDQIRATVNFVDGIQELLKEANVYFIEVGPGNMLATLLSQYDTSGKRINISSTTRHPKKKLNDIPVFLKALGQAWISGVNINWDNYYKGEKRYRVPLPSYPFERKRHWIDPETPFNYFNESSERIQEIKPVLSGTDSDEQKYDGKYLSFHDRPSMDEEYVEPKTDIEKSIAGIWENLLGIKGIGINDDFFYLGGHSLLASQIITRISEKFHVRLPLESLFESSTISGLIRKIESEKPVKQDTPDIISMSPDGRLPVSFDQKRLWILNQIDRNNPAYNIPFTYRLKGNLNVEIFIKSLKLLLDRQTILKSSIQSHEGEPYCLINNFETLPITFLDYSSYASEEVEQKIQDFFTGESRNIFDIENGPLFRFYLVKISDNESVFHMTVQHMVFDGWSWGIFAGELRQIYNDLLNNREIDLIPLKYQYYDIANWQESNITEDSFKTSIDYWKKQLKDHPAEINFPFSYSRTKRPTGFGSREPLRMTLDFSGKIREISQRENSTVFMTLLAGFSLLLNKYSGDNDICIGIPTANRVNSDTEEIIGLFVNTIILRLRFDNSLTFKELLHYTRNITIEGLAHQDLPFEKLVETLQPERKINVNPISQILFAYQNTPRPPLNLEGIMPERILIKDTVAPFDMTFYAWDNDGIVEGELEFNSDLFDREFIIRLKENFVFLLKSVIENPDQRISEISIISDNDRTKLEEFNRTNVPVTDCLVQSFFEQQSVIHPSKKAVISGDSSLTYKELNDQANQLAGYLISLGATEGDIIGICIERSVEMVISVLGVLKAGCSYLPMDPSFPDDRITFMFEDSGARALITQSSLMEKTRMFKTPIVFIDTDRGKIRKYSTVKPELILSPKSNAYTIYTSGSTGKPKGVKVHHAAVVNLIESMLKEPGIKENDILLAVVTLSFDMSVFELFVPLSAGATIVIAKSGETTDGPALTDLIKKHNITVIQATPSFWNILLSGGWQGKDDLKALCGGEALTSVLVRQILPKVNEFWNCYGPTETTVYSVYTKVIDPDAPILIGRPVNNTSIYILDKNNNQLPVGVIGEVCIGGLGVTKGYINRPDLTAEKFITLENKQIIYKTGDLGRFLIDGNVELFGRSDNQIKLRGFRIEPGEIESLLTQVQDVKEAVVIVHKFDENDHRLVAFLNVSDDFNIDTKELNRRLKEKLPSYMIPTFYNIMKEFPKTSNGKIDRKSLIFQINELGKTGSDEIEALTPTEKVIFKIWSETLKTEDITVTDNFFESGGNSLLAIAVFSKIESAFNIDLGLRVFFDSPRIKDLAEAIDISVKKSVKQKSVDKPTKPESKLVIGEI